MKKLLSGIVAIVVLMALATNVKAATMGAAKTVEQGGTITLKINLDNSHDAVGYDIKFDETKVSFDTSSTGLTNDDHNLIGTDVVRVGGYTGSTSTVTVTFKAKSDALGNAVFSIVSNDTDNESTPSDVTVEIVKKSEGGNTGNEGQQGGTTQENNGSKAEEKINDQGKKITKLPKTGTSYVAVAGLALTVLGSAAAARKISK